MPNLSPEETFESMKQRMAEAIREQFPYEGRLRKLELIDLKFNERAAEPTDSHHVDNLQAQFNARTSGRTWDVPAVAELRLVDTKTGNEIERKKSVIARLPKITRRYSYIIEGQERQHDSLFRSKPRPYHRIATNGEIQARWNLARGLGFDLKYEPGKGRILMSVGNSNVPLYSVLHALGVSDSAMQRTWGREIYEENIRAAKPAMDIAKLYKALSLKKKGSKAAKGIEEQAKAIKEYFEEGTEVWPDAMKSVFGKEFTNVNSENLLLSSKRLLSIQRGRDKDDPSREERPDDRQSLSEKYLVTTEDFIVEAIGKKTYDLQRKIRDRIDKPDASIDDILSSNAYTGVIRGVFDYSQRPDQTNPLQFLSGYMRTTIRGSAFGGVGSGKVNLDKDKQINPTHLGFLDPIQTPECWPGHAEVFTERGWVPWAEVRDSERFLCQVDGTVGFRPASKIHCGRYEGELYCLDQGKVSYEVTPNHRMWVSTPWCPDVWRFTTADKVHGKERRFDTAHDPITVPEPKTEFTLPAVEGNNSSKNVADPIDIVDWAEFMGWFLAEGSTYYKEDASRYHVRIHQKRAANPAKYAAIEALLNRLPFNWHWDGEDCSFGISTKQLAHYCSQFGLAHEKFIPEYLFEAPLEAREALLEALLLGDGRIGSVREDGRSYRQLVYTTVSPQLAVDVERLAVTLGYATTVKQYPDRREERYKDVFEVRLLQHRYRTARPRHPAYPAKFYTKNHSGLVYCATVPGSKLYCRMPGKVGFWSGNSDETGIALHLPLGVSIARSGAQKGKIKTSTGQDLQIRVYDKKKDDWSNVTPADLEHEVVAYPDQVKWVKGKPVPVEHEVVVYAEERETTRRPWSKVRYVLPSSKNLFSFSANLVPFLQNNSGNRAMMAAKQQEQAVSLKDREAPLVQVKTDSSRTFEDVVGSFSSHRAPVSGKVTKVEPDMIHIKSGNKTTKVPIYKDYPLNGGKGLMTSQPVVKVGQQVKKGDLLADTNYTKDGKLSLGSNLRVAYVPWKGLNFEDGIVVSETAAKKMTSSHLHQAEITIYPGMRGGKEGDLEVWRDYAVPERTAPEKLRKLGSDGIIKKGQKVEKGDILVAALTPRQEVKEDEILRTINKSLVKPFADRALVWEHDYPGEVVRVVRTPGTVKFGITVHIRTDEPLAVGDKLCYAEDHEILTRQGWVSVADVELYDEVCSLNPDTGKIEYLKPAELHEYDCEGDDLYVVETTQVSMAVTMEHKIYAKPRGADRHSLTPASQLVGKRYRLKMDGTWEGRNSTSVVFPAMVVKTGQGGRGERELPAFSLKTEAYLMLLGMYLSEGNCYSGSGNHYIEITQIKQPNRQQAEDALREAGIQFTDAGDKIRIYSKQLYKHFSRFGVAHEKYIPSHILGLRADLLEILYRWMMWGDGCVTSSPPRYTTVSRKLADGFQQLLLHTGRAGRVITEPASRGEIKGKTYDFRTRYRVQVIEHRLQPTINHDHGKTPNGQSERVEKYTGKVYCVALPRNHVLYTRRGGKAHWSGNTGRHGNKGIVSRIVPDHKMPHDKQGEPVHVLLNPAGIPSRMNVGQILETAASKIAKKTGKPYVIENFVPGMDYSAKVKKDLKKHGLSDTEELVDPETGRSIGQIMVGDQYMLKLHHMVEKKQTARSYGTYSGSGDAPSGSGIPGGGQKLDALTTYAMLAHGAKHNLREAQTYKSDEAQEEVWDAVMTGRPLPAPKPSTGMNNFLAYLKAMGVNTEKKGDEYILMPLTDSQIVGGNKARGVSKGELEMPEKALYAKGAATLEEAKGLFDPKLTGGIDGPYWTHISLPSRMPNPVFEPAIQTLLGLTQKEYEKLTGPDLQKGGKDGFEIIVDRLKDIDVDKKLEEEMAALPKAKKSELNSTYKRIRYLKSLKKLGMSPVEAYTNKVVPVIPPKMRKVSIGLDGTQILDDLNTLYLTVGYATQAIKNADKSTTKGDLQELRAHLYDTVKGLRMTGMSLGRSNRHHTGLMEKLTGKVEGQGAPKYSFFQKGVLSRRQDLSGRSTIVPEPDMGLDEVGIPTPIALEMYRPFVIRELFRDGTKPNKGDQLVDKKHERAIAALERVLQERPVMLKRDPALHKFSIMAFKPKLVEGKAIKIHPLVTGGFNADFDGDTMALFVPVSDQAADEARKMLPSQNLFSPTHFGLMPVPAQDSLLGLYQATKWGTKKPVPKGTTTKKAIQMMEDGKLKPDDVIQVGGKDTTPGRLLLAQSMPEEAKKDKLLYDPEFRLDKKNLKSTLGSVAKKNPDAFPVMVDTWKDHGNRLSYLSGSSFSLDDFHDGKTFRDYFLRGVRAEEDAIRKSRKPRKQKDKEIVDLYTKVREKLKEVGEARYTREGKNRMYEWKQSGAKGNWNQFSQLVFGPMLVTDPENKQVPVPITKSYGEGLSLSQYWASMHGARKGTLDRAAGTREPGALTKDIINTVINTHITADDCGTQNGVSMAAGHRDVEGRYLAKLVRLKDGTEITANTLVTPALQTRMQNSGVGQVVVRSPMHCEMKRGICAKCFGMNESGKHHSVGTNIGVISGHALGEPVTQLTMRTFHTGGVGGGGGVVDSFSRVKQLFKVPKKLPNKAVLAEVGGTVQSVQKDARGGYTITVAGKEHRVVTGKPLPGIRVGTRVRKGEQLSDGLVDPVDLLSKTKSMPKVRAYMADEIEKAYQGMVRRRNIETVVKSMTNLTDIKSAPYDSGYLRGQSAPLSEVEEYNRKARQDGRETIKHAPKVRPMTEVPLEVQEDWMARLNYQKLKSTYQEGAAQGWSSNIHDHPIPGLAHGAEFGLKTPKPLAPPNPFKNTGS